MDDRRATHNSGQPGAVPPSDWRRLWVAVMAQAVRDAVNYGDGAVRNPPGLGGSLSWFDGRDCRLLCDLLDLDRDRLRAGVHELRRAAMAQGRRRHMVWEDLVADVIEGAGK